MIPSERVAELLKEHGEIGSQAISEWDGPFPLPGAVNSFYHDIGPIDICIQESVTSTFFRAFRLSGSIRLAIDLIIERGAF